jgi:predicted permease
MNVNRALVAPGYFAVVRIPILEGRDFTEQDSEQAPPVMIVNQAFAQRYFHGGNPVGRKVRVYRKTLTVVGVARDSKYFTPIEPAQPHFYLPFRQFQRQMRELYFFVRTPREPEQAIPTLRRVVAATDPNAAAFHAVSLTEYTRVALFPQKVAASLMGTLGLMCLLLAALGLYSVMSYAVSQRTQEIGIRMAMGAQPGDVVGMVVRQGMGMAFGGLTAGIAASLAASRLVASMLVNVNASDPATLAAVALFLLLVALAATWLPAYRATRINPTVALRRQ